MLQWIGNNRRLLLRLLGTIVAVVLIVVLVRGEAWGDVLGALRQLTWTRIAGALALVVLSRLFVAARWYVLLRSGNVQISAMQPPTFTGLFSNNFLPRPSAGRCTTGAQCNSVTIAQLPGVDRRGAVYWAAGMLHLPLGLIPTIQNLTPAAAQASGLAGLFGRATGFVRRTVQTFSIWFGRPLGLLAALGCTWGHMLCTFLTMYTLIEALGSHVDLPLIAGLWSVSYFVTLVPIRSTLRRAGASLTCSSRISRQSTPTSVTVVLMRTLLWR
jgi:uncharacterized membrane protein YbhN (UPF0104 family)